MSDELDDCMDLYPASRNDRRRGEDTDETLGEASKGPYAVVVGSDNDTGNHPADIVAATGHPIALVTRVDKAAGGDYLANAHLLAASWDMFEALRKLLYALSMEPEGVEVDRAVVNAREVLNSTRQNW